MFRFKYKQPDNLIQANYFEILIMECYDNLRDIDEFLLKRRREREKVASHLSFVMEKSPELEHAKYWLY